MATWDLGLPQTFEQSGFSHNTNDSVLRINPNWGLPLTRPQTSLDVKTFSGSMLLTKAQKLTLETFYKTNKGISFNFPDQINDDPDGTRVYLSCKFVGSLGFSAVSDLFRVSFSVEYYG